MKCSACTSPENDVKVGTVTLQTEVPSRLFEELQTLVDAGWSRDIGEVVWDGLRRYAK